MQWLQNRKVIIYNSSSNHSLRCLSGNYSELLNITLQQIHQYSPKKIMLERLSKIENFYIHWKSKHSIGKSDFDL